MKKIIAVFLSVCMSITMISCSNNQNETTQPTQVPSSAETTPTETTPAEAASPESILIAYFSVMETDGVDTVSGASRVAVDGELVANTEYIANIIQQEVGGTVVSVETVQDYPRTHGPLLEFAYNEREEGARPELTTQIEDLDTYDVIFLGYPNWNADLPMPLYTLLEEYDFSGKTIIPFTTHGGSGLSRTIQTIQQLQPEANVITDGLSISRNSIVGSENSVINWISGLNLGSE